MTYTDQFHKEYLAQQNISDLQQVTKRAYFTFLIPQETKSFSETPR